MEEYLKKLEAMCNSEICKEWDEVTNELKLAYQKANGVKIKNRKSKFVTSGGKVFYEPSRNDSSES